MPVHSRPIPGLICTDHVVEVPLDHDDPARGRIEVYAREVRAVEKAGDEQPYLLFLQGGPGGMSPRFSARSGWLAEAVQHYRVILLDQRGTGRSSAITDRTPARVGGDDATLAAHLSLFRADAIVRDAELLRVRLTRGAPWFTLGQSYGGFCTMTYLSMFPSSLAGCLVTGGLPGLDTTADDVYRLTWPKVLAKNAEYRRRFPSDQSVLRRLRDAIRSRPDGDPIRLPGGDPLSVHRLQSLGASFGMSYGYAELHHLLELAFDGVDVSTPFLADVERRTEHVSDPLYAVLQEVIYAQNTSTRWAAERVRAEFPEAGEDAEDVVLFGEMKLPAVFGEQSYLAPFTGAMDILNAKDDWPALYDAERLSRNEVPIAAAVYHDDLYVPVELSLPTAAAVPNLRPWITNRWEHDGLRSDIGVFSHLRDLLVGLA